MRRSVLFLARSFPPAENIGAVRARSIAFQLAQRDWHVRVVTVGPTLLEQSNDGQLSSLIESGVELWWTGHHLRFLLPGFLRSESWARQRYVGGSLRRLARLLGLDSGAGWIAPTLKACRELEAGDVDLVLATAPPHASFELAYLLSRRFKRPYVLDYRDPWTISAFRESQLPFWKRSIEKYILSRAAGAITVSESMAAAMKAEFGGVEIDVLPNGYDQESAERVVPHHFDHPAIVYAGSFYPPKLVIDPFMEAMRLLPSIADGVKFHYYGNYETHVMEQARRFEVEHRVVLHGRVLREQVLSSIKGAALAVVITSVNENGTRWDNGVVTGKLFEPLGLRTPILLISPNNSDARRIINETDSGRCFVGSDVRGMTDFITNVVTDRMRFSFVGAERYSWSLLGHNLHELLERFI